MKSYCIAIPARYDSSRFPGKVFANILGKPLIQRVWEQCTKATNKEDVYIITPDESIRKYCEKMNMKFIMTSKECETGTDRIAEAFEETNILSKYDIVINVQGDEPLVQPSDILRVAVEADKNHYDVFCGMCKISNKEDFENRNVIKLVTDTNNRLMYASRSPIPCNKNGTFSNEFLYKQVCIYAFTSIALSIFRRVERAKNERLEDIEILRFLEHNILVKMVEVSNSSISVDVPEDIVRVENQLIMESR